jgi:hypothetical protein
LRLGGDEFGLVVQERVQASRSAAIVAASTQAAFICQDLEGSSPRLTRFIAFTVSSTSA